MPATVAWLAEEVGELAQAVRKGTPDEQEHEFADVLAWLASLANQVGIDLADAVDRYADGCPRCASIPCACDADWARSDRDGSRPQVTTVSGPAARRSARR